MQNTIHVGIKLEPEDHRALGIIAAERGTSRSALAKEQVVRMIRRKGGNFRKGGSI